MGDHANKTNSGSQGTGSSSGAGRTANESSGMNAAQKTGDQGMKGAPGTTGGSTYHANPGRERDRDADKTHGGNR
jgi:hypothetical protein